MHTTDITATPSTLISLAGTEGLFPEEVRARVATGARLVRFEYCISAIVFTIRRQSAVYLTQSWQERYLRGIWFSVAALLLGPWGVPWGLIWTPWAMWVNITGGIDETDAVLAWIDENEKAGSPVSPPNSQNPENRC